MTARIYVGTYAKYNSGSIAGAWLDLEDYADRDAFLEACHELHKDEPDPHDRELLDVYHEGVDESGDIYRAREAFMGKGYNNEADWAAEWLEDTGGLEGVPKHLENYIDYAAYARDARMGGDGVFVRKDGELWVFSNT